MTSTDAARPVTSLLRAGQEALADGRWQEARTSFQAALDREQTAEALEGLGLAAWNLDDAETTFETRLLAYRLYRERGDRRSAARLATRIAWDYQTFRAESAVANGWLQRAHRLLDGLPPAPEHGWLAIREGSITLFERGDTARARSLAAEAAALGRSLNLFDLEMLGLALEGLALVSEGELDSGMPLLDESSAAIVAGELTDTVAQGLIFCFLIFACERTRDFDRASQWCERLRTFSVRWRIRSLFAVCRTQYASLLIWHGRWGEAEAELAAAVDELQATRPGQVGEGVARLGELRLLQGRWQEAARMFDQAEFHPLAQLGRAELALGEGDGVQALELAERYLRRVSLSARTERVAGLELLVRASVAIGRPEQGEDARAELKSIAAAIPTDPLRAAAAFAHGLIDAAHGRHEEARRSFEDALDLYQRSVVPFEAARARLELARSLLALGRIPAAAQAARAALDTFRDIAAMRESARALAVLREIEQADQGRGREPQQRWGLTPREIDVLRLVAQGLSNQEIAGTLGLSEHTIHRHVGNILTKLDLPSRAAAVAHASRNGLI